MESLYFLIPLSLVILVVAVAIFFWAVNDGQYDDLEGEAERILFEEADVGPPTTVENGEPNLVSENND